MKKWTFLVVLLTLILTGQLSNAQNQDKKFKMEGGKSETINLNETFSSSQEIFPFSRIKNKIYGVAVSAKIDLTDEESLVRLVLVDEHYEEYQIYESYGLLDGVGSFSIEEICEETAILNGVKAVSIKVEVTGAAVTLNRISISYHLDPSVKTDKVMKERKQLQNEDKINRLNKNLKEKGKMWVAGHTQVAELSYSDRKKLYGGSTFPNGFEYYAGGIVSTQATGTESNYLKSATASLYVENWDWRTRHGKNWITPVVNQGTCGSCWAFAAAGATEAMVNLYYNQKLNLNLSEQELVSCSGAGSCSGGYPYKALDYIKNTGIIDEATFPYTQDNGTCTSKGTNPSELIKIGGRYDFGSSLYPKTEDVLKDMLIKMGPVSGGLSNWSHAMALVGYKVVKEGDIFYYRDLELKRYWITIKPGDPLIGKTVWIFKNSWGSLWGDAGYIYVETAITNMSWTHGIKGPITSNIKNYQVICEDNDGDGYFWWGLGPKPVTCNCPDEPDGDDSDPALGPLDEYGNCRILTGTPTANFSASLTVITEGETVIFSDLSVNAQSWSWVFEGGNPATSNIPNPAVNYTAPGIYSVSLTVVNSNGYDTKTVGGFVTVKPTEIISDETVNNETIDNGNIINDQESVPEYCISMGNATEEWISSVIMGITTKTSGSAGTAGYDDQTGSTIFTADAGASLNFTLTPTFLNKWQYEYWRIWIDYNMDKDFDDSGELVYSSSPSKGGVSGSIPIPQGLSATTRMRIAMKRNALPGPCETFLNGEVEDYTIRISEPVPLPPEAAFTADKTSVTIGETVRFSDLSSNEPTQWQWQFPGGTPSFSSDRNPVVTYNSPGSFDVTLTVTKAGSEPSQEVKLNYIVAAENTLSDYCIPIAVNSPSDYILNVIIGNEFNTTSAGNGYSMATSAVPLSSGKSYSTILRPKVLTNRNYWKMWIDFNMDGDFNDINESVLTISNKKGEVCANIIIPQGVSGETRMRLAMRNMGVPEACGDGYEGDVKDFPVILSPPQTTLLTTARKAVPDDAPGVQLYPNPVTEKLTIELKVTGENDRYVIYNMQGEKLRSDRIFTMNTFVDLSENAPGVYFIVVENNSWITRNKIIKK